MRAARPSRPYGRPAISPSATPDAPGHNPNEFRFRRGPTRDRIVHREVMPTSPASSSFDLVLPFPSERTPGNHGRGRSISPGDPALDLPKGPPKIVIADDNIQNVELLEAYLSDFDCDIRTAFDGEETLRVVAEFAPALLLLDVMMPRLSGFEVCRKLRANPATRELLVLM